MQKQTRKYKKTEILFSPHKWHHSSQLTDIAIVIALVSTGKSPEIQFINLIRTYVCLLLITSHHTYYNYPRHNCHAEPPTRHSTWQDNGWREGIATQLVCHLISSLRGSFPGIVKTWKFTRTLIKYRVYTCEVIIIILADSNEHLITQKNYHLVRSNGWHL